MKKLRIAENCWENFQTCSLGITYWFTLTFIHSNWKRTIRYRIFFKIFSTFFLTVSFKSLMGVPGGTKLSQRSQPGAERSDAWRSHSPTGSGDLVLSRRGPPLRAEKWISGFHKVLIGGVFFQKSPGHLLKKPRTFTGFFLTSLIFTVFPCFFLPKTERYKFFFFKIFGF